MLQRDDTAAAKRGCGEGMLVSDLCSDQTKLIYHGQGVVARVCVGAGCACSLCIADRTGRKPLPNVLAEAVADAISKQR